MKKTIIKALIFSMLTMTACGTPNAVSDSAEDTAAAETTAETAIETTVTTEETTEETTTAEETTEDIDVQQKKNEISEKVLSVLHEAFDTNFDFSEIDYDEESNTYSVSYSNEGLGNAIHQVQAGNIDASVWDEFSMNVLDLAKKTYIMIRSYDTKAHLEINLVNDADSSEVFLTYLDGKRQFSAMEDN